MAHGASGLDLQHYCRQWLVCCYSLSQFFLQEGDILGRLDERVADHVGMASDEIQILAVPSRERHYVEVSVRKVQALIGPDLFAVGSGECPRRALAHGRCVRAA